MDLQKELKKLGLRYIHDDLAADEAAARFSARRQALYSTVNHPIILKGVPDIPGTENPFHYAYHPVFQDPNILYLSGLNQANIAMIINGEETVLFLPTQDEKMVFWEGHYFSTGRPELDTIARALLGVDRIEKISDFDACCRQLIREYPRIGIIWDLASKKKSLDRFSKSYYAQFKNRLAQWAGEENVSTEWINIAQPLYEQRLCLDSTDIQMAKKAQGQIQTALVQTFEDIPTMSSETEVAGSVMGRLLSQSPYGLSFSPIVAVDENASILHYTNNQAKFPKNGLLLIDSGGRWQSMCSDISRTVPVNGQFTPMQACLYQCVLDTQRHVESELRPGRSIAQLNTLAWDFLNKALDQRFIQKGGKVSLSYETQPHFIGHALGISVHDGDAYGRYRDWPLKEGMYITNEPGLYGDFEWDIDGVHEKQSIGIRIEDNLLVTKNGCENLSRNIPKTIEDIQSIMS